MVGAILTRRLRIFGMAALCAATGVPSVSAEPIAVTSGFFIQPEDGPPGFSFSGPDGFVLSAFFPRTTSSPFLQCFSGCLPGTAVNMSTTAAGDSTVTRFTLGTSPGAMIYGTEFGDLSQF